MRLDHLTDREKLTRSENFYEPRGFVWHSSGFDLLDAVGIALCIQKELVAASVIPDFKRQGSEIVDSNWTDVIKWIASPDKDEDDHAIYRSLVLTDEEVILLDDYADVLAPLAKGITKTSMSKFNTRYKTAAQRSAENKAKKLAKEMGEPSPDAEDEEDNTSKGVSVILCDVCEDFAYVPNGFSSKKCTLTLGCDGTLVKPPKVERVWTTKKKNAAAKRAARAATAED